MGNRKVLVVGMNDEIEFIIRVELNDKGDTVTKLYYSNSEIWTTPTRGRLILELIDDGNGTKIKFHRESKRTLNNLDYEDTQALRLILSFESKEAKNDDFYFVDGKDI